jgi:hypothetical protein
MLTLLGHLLMERLRHADGRWECLLTGEDRK